MLLKLQLQCIISVPNYIQGKLIKNICKRRSVIRKIFYMVLNPMEKFIYKRFRVN